jgi:ABC-2 type transport system ATP-binding protein
VCPLKESKGEIFGLLRPNGVGKTTTLEMMEGLRKSDSGTILVADVNVGEATRKVKSHIGVQLQSSSFFDHLKGVQP